MTDSKTLDPPDSPPGAPETAPTVKESKWLGDVASFVVRNPVLPLLIIVVPVCAAVVPGFGSVGNLRNLLLQSAVLLVLVAGGATVVITGNFDLSSLGTALFVSDLAGWLMAPAYGIGLNPVLVIVLSVLVGVAVGAVNGVLVAVFRVNPFVVTLATLLTLEGASAIPTSANTIYNLPSLYSAVGQRDILGINWLVIVAFALFLLLAAFLRVSVFGRHLYAVGGNADAARHNGISPVKIVIAAFIISGALAAVGGWLASAWLDSAGPQTLDGSVVWEIFGAIVIGGIALTGGKGSMFGALGGVILLAIVNNALDLLNVNVLYVDFIFGAAILVAVLLIVARQEAASRLGLVERAP